MNFNSFKMICIKYCCLWNLVAAAMKLRPLLLGRKAMTNQDSIIKSRGITLPTKVHLVKAMVFPVVMYGCESWTVKKAEHRRIDAFGNAGNPSSTPALGRSAEGNGHSLQYSCLENSMDCIVHGVAKSRT